MDFIERLVEKVNTFQHSSISCKAGYLGVGESFVVYPSPGSKIIRRYMSGTTDQQLNFEFAMKSKSHSTIHDTLWLVQTKLENLTKLKSNDGSFQFDEINITDKPFISNADEQGWVVFLLSIQAKITVLKGDEN